MMLPPISKRTAIAAFILILLAQVSVICYWGSKKIGFHMDEIFTYSISNGSWNWISSDVWMTKRQILDSLTVQADERFNFLHVIANHSKDVHPPFYYLVFHFVCSLVPDVFTKWSGIAVNIFFFVLTQLTVFLISSKLTQNKALALLPCLFYGFSIGAHTTAMMVRMYMALTFFCTMAFYLHVILVKKIEEQKDLGYRELAVIFVTYFFGIMTHYYFIVFGFFASIFFLIFLLIRKYYKFVIAYICIVGSSIPMTILCYPAMIKHIFKGYRGKEAIKNAFAEQTFDRFSAFYDIINHDLLVSLFIFIFALYFAYKVFSNFITINIKKENNIHRITMSISYRDINIEYKLTSHLISIVFAVFCSLFFFCVISKIAAYKANRYIVCIYPLICIYTVFISVYIFKCINYKMHFIAAVTLVCISLSCTHMESDAGWLFRDQRAFINLVKKYDNSKFIVIHHSKKRWHCWSLGHCFALADNIYITDENKHQKINIEEQQGILCIDKDISEKNSIRQVLEKDASKKICSFAFFDVYELHSVVNRF